MPSESIWKKQSSILQQDANSISVLKEQIHKQTEIDANVQLSIDDKIQKLKKNACLLAKKLQNEKHRNHELQTIINYMKGKMEAEKLQEASFRDNINSENIASLENKLKKLEYDLGQANIKTNRLAENVEQKRSKISQNRTERVIDSGIFRNIEKELIDSELRFKKLLIQKVRHQKQYEKLVESYNQLRQKAEKYVQKDVQKSKSNHLVSSTQLKHEDSKKKIDSNKFKKLESVRQTKGRSPTIKKSEQIDFEGQKYVVCIKKILSETGIESTYQLLSLFQDIDQTNEKHFNEINNYIDQANQIERYLAEASKTNGGNTRSFCPENVMYSKQVSSAKLQREKIESIKSHKKQIQNELETFMDFFESQNFSIFVKQLDVQLPPIKEDTYINYQTLTQTLQLLQSNIQQFLTENPTQDRNKSSIVKNSENLQQMMSRVKKSQEYLKVMKKQDFQEEYRKITKNTCLKSSGSRSVIKKKSVILKK